MLLSVFVLLAVASESAALAFPMLMMPIDQAVLTMQLSRLLAHDI